MAIVDAAVLINAAKLDCLYLLREVFGQLMIGPAVQEEVITRGIETGAMEVSYVRSAITNGWLQMVRPSRGEGDLTRQLLETTNLHASEAESIALAKDRRQRLIADGKEARGVTRLLGVQCLGMPGVILEAFATNRIDAEEYESLVMRLADITSLSAGVVARMLNQTKGAR